MDRVSAGGKPETVPGNRSHHLEALVEASKLLNSTLDLEQLLEIILDIATRNTQAQTGTIYVLDHDGQTLWSRVTDYQQKKNLHLPLGKGVAGHVALTGETVNITDAYQNPHFAAEFDVQSGFHTRSMLCMPMRDGQGHIVGVFQLINKQSGEFSGQDMEFLQDLSIHAALAIRQAEWHRDAMEKRTMETEMGIAREIQSHLLPGRCPVVDGWDLAAFCKSCQAVGGDYYDAFMYNDRLVIVIGDVAGKGVAAALLMAGVHAALHAPFMMNVSLPPAERIAYINQFVRDSAPHSRFVTFFYAEVDPGTGSIWYVNAGHNPPFALLPDGTPAVLPRGGLPLGVQAHGLFQAAEMTLQPGQALVLYTDGISEAMNEEQEEFGEARLLATIRSVAAGSAQDMVDTLLLRVEQFRGAAAPNDDQTLLVIKRLSFS